MQETKKNYFMGLVTGIAVIALIGFLIMTIMYLQARQLPSKAFNQVNANQKNTSKTEIEITKSDHVRGNPNAAVTIIEFSDFQCPYCSQFHQTMRQIMQDFPNDVRWVYKHFPLDSIHPYARKAAEASECADEQDKFWEFTDELFANQSSIKTDYFSSVAEKIGLDVNQFDACLSSGKYKSKVDEDYQQGINAGVRGTPGNFINGQEAFGALPYEQIKNIIENSL